VQGLDIWPILAVFSLISLVIATFISHTIASVLIVPVAAEIGNAMESPHPRLLIMVSPQMVVYFFLLEILTVTPKQATALVCSSGMGLPISGYPNLQA
jgi:phosphate transporter